MAAITPFIEHPADEAESSETHFDGFGDATPAQTAIGEQSAGLHRFVWTRSVIHDWLAKREFSIELSRGQFVFRLDAPVPQDLVPWSLTYELGQKDRFPLWSEGNKKMATLAWDLPAGASSTGGSCPAATMGQPVVPMVQRRLAGLREESGMLFLRRPPPGPDESPIQIPFREASAICLYCYAESGRFGYTDVMVTHILRYWWSQQMLKQGRVDEWVKVMADSLDVQPPPISGVAFGTGRFRAIRVHSSGDYFAPQYADAWVQLANEIAYREDQRGEEAPIIFWSPTRTWAMDNFDWKAILGNLRRGRVHGGREIVNLIVRPSAYHVNDPAPFALADGNAVGTTSTSDSHKADFTDAEGEHVKLFDYVCPAYAADAPTKEKEDNSCEGNHCRVCWMEPTVRVTYPLH